MVSGIQVKIGKGSVFAGIFFFFSFLQMKEFGLNAPKVLHHFYDFSFNGILSSSIYNLRRRKVIGGLSTHSPSLSRLCFIWLNNLIHKHVFSLRYFWSTSSEYLIKVSVLRGPKLTHI